MMNNVRLLIEYDGTHYHGWQRQASPNSESGDLYQTIQGTLEGVLSRIIKQPAKVVAAGRTDSGVHATGQVAHFRTNLKISELSWVKAINSLLPDDIIVKRADYVPADFNARFDAKYKVYKYVILNSDLPSPFQRNYVWHMKYPLNTFLMKEGAKYLTGHHDFSSFRASDCSAKSPAKTLDRLGIEIYPGSLVIFTFQARSFLQHMVRNIVGTLTEVGREKITPSDIKNILEKRDRRCAGPIAPPHGLYLTEVVYQA